MTPEPLLTWYFTVGVAGFEPTTSSSRTKRATKLRYTPAGGAGKGVWPFRRLDESSGSPAVPRSLNGWAGCRGSEERG